MSALDIQIGLMRSDKRLTLYFSHGAKQATTTIDTTSDQVGQITGYINGQAIDLFTLDEAIQWLETSENEYL